MKQKFVACVVDMLNDLAEASPIEIDMLNDLAEASPIEI